MQKVSLPPQHLTNKTRKLALGLMGYIPVYTLPHTYYRPSLQPERSTNNVEKNYLDARHIIIHKYIVQEVGL